MIDVNVEVRATQMVTHDVDHARQNVIEQMPVLGMFVIAVERLEKPESGVGGMIQPVHPAFREHVGDQAVA